MSHTSRPSTSAHRRTVRGLAAAAVLGTGLVVTGLVGSASVATADPAAVRPDPTMTAIAPTTAPTSAPHAPIGERFARTELYFGTERPGPDVTDAQFAEFVGRVVTPRFPDGLTQYDALGQFRDSSGRIVKERSKVIILLYPVADAGPSSAQIERIRDVYETAFQQESVLRADSVDLVSF
ncbi:MAG TPA: DUF3574 domain-containing protein [Microlunatus sp.]|nr:DUF3574 domain-containing protein [Microlunatus sp.]